MAAASSETKAKRKQAQSGNQHALAAEFVGESAGDAAGYRRNHHHHRKQTPGFDLR